ncbi:hypothetical protein HOY80DRAFT_1029186 [Tuber brumale]|nr:hypothetical protein HOY80DRAFT_1029186 [Tuber brumale]
MFRKLQPKVQIRILEYIMLWNNLLAKNNSGISYLVIILLMLATVKDLSRIDICNWSFQVQVDPAYDGELMGGLVNQVGHTMKIFHVRHVVILKISAILEKVKPGYTVSKSAHHRRNITSVPESLTYLDINTMTEEFF